MPEDSLKILSSKSMFELRLSFNVIVSKAGAVSTSQPMSRRKDLFLHIRGDISVTKLLVKPWTLQ